MYTMSGATFHITPNKKKTICFATMCKNEEHCIRDTLESVYKYIDTWVVHDTGSTDKTCQIVTEFFKEKNIPGELFCDEWKGFDINKTQLFNKCYGRSDYILHCDADDIFVGNVNLNFHTNDDAYHMYTKRGNSTYKCILVWNNHLHWKFCGVAHTIVKCIDKPHGYSVNHELVKDDVYLLSRDTGNRSTDPLKYFKDGERLQKQFFDTLYDDPDGLNNRSVFYAARSYYDANEHELALKWFNLYLRLKNTWEEEQFQSHLQIADSLIQLKRDYTDINKHFDAAMSIFPDRAEPLLSLAKYCNCNNKHEEAYQLLHKARSFNYSDIEKKYILFTVKTSYGKYLLDELSVSCYWTNRFEEGKQHILNIIDDPDFKDHKDRFNDNLRHFDNKLLM